MTNLLSSLPHWLKDHLVYYPILKKENRKTYLQNILKSMGYTILQRAGWSHPPQKTYLRQATFEILGI